MPEWRVGRISGPGYWKKLTSGFTQMRALTYVASPRDVLVLFDQGYESVELILGYTLDASAEIDLHKGMKKEGAQDPTAIERMATLIESGRLSIRVPRRKEHSKYYVLENSETIRVMSPSYNLTGSRQGNTFMLLDFSKADVNDPYEDALTPYESIRGDSTEFPPTRDLLELIQGKSGEERTRRITVWLTTESESTEEEESDKVTLGVAEIVAKALAKLRVAPSASLEDRIFTVRLPSDPKERKQFLDATARWEPRVFVDEVGFDPEVVLGSTYVQSGKNQVVDWPTAWIEGPELLVGFRGSLRSRTAREMDKEAVRRGIKGIEGYIDTIDRAQTANLRVRERAKYMMYETLLAMFAAPFQHDYMRRKRAQYIVDVEGPPLLIVTGQSGNGKTRFLKYCLKLIVGEIVGVLHAPDTLSKAKARNARGRILCFPLVFDEVHPRKLAGEDIAGLIKSWWEAWWTPEIPTPTVVFCGNDLEQKDWMGRRTKRVEFEVHHEKSDKNERLLDSIFAESNDIYLFFTKQYLELVERGIVSLDALDTARRAMRSLYKIAEVPMPSYFPAVPVEDKFDIGRERWLEAIEHGKIAMTMTGNPYFAEFDPYMDKQIVEYLGYLRSVKHRREGLRIVLQVPEAFVSWIGKENLDASIRRQKQSAGGIRNLFRRRR